MSLPVGAAPLAIGTLLAFAQLLFVIWPLVRASSVDEETPTSDADIHRGDPVEASLEELELDFRAGKLLNDDYEALRIGLRASVDDDVAESAIRRARQRQRSCVRCGPRSEPEAVYCSSCGHYLAGQCPACHSPVTMPASSFCDACGRAVADI